ncbi:MAG: hypothetical protein ABC527_06870, partial [Candidatus Methanosuratincola petrocarbonis]
AFSKAQIEDLINKPEKYKVIAVNGNNVLSVSFYDNKEDAISDCCDVTNGVIKYLVCDAESIVIRYTCDSITEVHIHQEESLSRLSTDTNITNLYGKCIACKHWKAFTISKNMDGLCEISKEIKLGIDNCDVTVLESHSTKRFAFDESIFE